MKNEEINLMDIQAVNDKIVCILLQKSNTTSGGIVLPDDTSQEPQKYGKVISVGEDIKEKDTIKKDDIILFHPSGGMSIILEGAICQVLSYQEIYGVIKNKG